ncbi:unnamed protein product [Schistosoma margrebowiei]|uniref:Uncharacterized protein n=1 Tax=Schistosoma margrebowiei TaxID=48269 RepID=A0AA84ZGN4_9TREM|nr:unnamed protein product [Schistosoma margrebowiei]
MIDPVYYDGGLFKFIPFDNNTWIIELIKQSVEKKETQFIISVCIISCLLCLITIIKIIFIHDNNNNVTYKNSVDNQCCNALKLISSSYHKTYRCFNSSHHDNTSIFNDQFNKRDNNKQYIKIQHNKLQVSKVLPITESLKIKHFNKHNIQPVQFIDHIQCDHDHLENNPNYKLYIVDLFKFHKNSLYRLFIYSIIVIICFLICLYSFIISYQHKQNLIQQMNNLPFKLKLILLEIEQFSHYAIDITYNLTKIHIHNDLLQNSSTNSLLNQFIHCIKQFIAKIITCLATTNLSYISSNSSLTIFKLKQNNLSFIQLEKINIESNMILNNFDLVLNRYINLNNVARLLNEEVIRKIEHSWYTYRQSLSSLTYLNEYLMKENITSISFFWWYTSPIIQQTKYILCDSLKHSKLIDFTTCNEIDEFLLNLIQYSIHLPLNLQMKSLTSVLMYDFIPRALNIEHLIYQWLPIIDNLSNNCINFLFETYLKPEINKIKYEISIFIKQFPSVKLVEQLKQIINYFNIALLSYHILFISLSIILIIIYIYIFILYYQFIKGRNHQYKTWINNKGQFKVYIHRPVFLRFTLCIISIICFLMIMVSLTSVYISLIGINEGCIYLQSNHLAQIKADELITKYLKVFIDNLNETIEFLSIPNLNLKIPQNILKTINSKYTPDHLPLLKSLHINRPLNFINILNSNYIYSLLYNIWYKEIINKTKYYDLKSKIPPINYRALYEQTKLTFNLTYLFDDLYVGHVNDYLIHPGFNYFRIILRNLKKISNDEHNNLIKFYKKLNRLYKEYHNNYLLIENQLNIIEQNKIILKPFDKLANICLNLLEQIQNLSNLDIEHLIDQLFPISWYELKLNLIQYIIPFIHYLLDDLIPFNGLYEIYINGINTICPIINNNNNQQLSMLNIKPILNELKWMSIIMTIGCIFLLLLSLINSLLL